jgi:two-component system, OmpR family, alkaline phosphatase synthesis response regulator PhoP
MNLTGKRILIIDDEPDIREFVSYNLAKKGYVVASAADGISGYELATKFEPDLIILDILMPGMNGYEACLKLRNNPQFAKTQIVFLSALNQSYAKDLGFRMDADAYLCKPVRMEFLVRRVDQWMREAV